MLTLTETLTIILCCAGCTYMGYISALIKYNVGDFRKDENEND